MIFHTVVEPNGCGDSLLLWRTNLDKFSATFCYIDVKYMHESLLAVQLAVQIGNMIWIDNLSSYLQ